MKDKSDRARLQRKLRALDALVTGAATDGERGAAAHARQRIQARLGKLTHDDAVEYRFILSDDWSQQLFAALCRRHGLEPYRRSGQRRSTLFVQVSPEFVDVTLWPEFERHSVVLNERLSAATDAFIQNAIGAERAPAATKASKPPERSRRRKKTAHRR